MAVTKDVVLGKGVVIMQPDLVNIYGCSIGSGTKIGAFVEIQKGVKIGSKCKISSHSFICEGVTIEDEVFIGHGAMFINDLNPHATNEGGKLQTKNDWYVVTTQVKRKASIGTNATILAGIKIGEGSLVGAGAVVTKDVPAHTVVIGNPAKVLKRVEETKS